MASRRNPRGLVIAATVILALCVVAGALGAGVAQASSSPSASPAPGGDVYKVGWLESPENLNPFIGYMTSDWVLWHLNYDYLVGYDPKTLEPRPEFAESWTTSADGLTWTFTVRKGMTWQDGEPATARDVAFTYQFIIDNNMGWYTPSTEGIESVKALDDYTVQFTTKQPKANMLVSQVPILPEHVWAKVGGKAASTSFTNPVPIVGSGPYQIVEYKKDSYVKVRANPGYWRGAPKVKEIVFQYYTNPTSMNEDLKLGVLDAAVGIPRAQFAALSGTPGVTTTAADSLNWYHLGFNTYDSPDSLGNPVLLDEKFRQALEWAVDRQKALDVAAQGYGVLGQVMIPPAEGAQWQLPADQAYAYDPAKAGELLTAAGYKMGSDGYRTTPQGKPLTLRLFASTSDPLGGPLAKLTASWFKAVGVNTKVTEMSDGALVDSLFHYVGATFKPDFDAYIWWWTNTPDHTFAYSMYTPEQIGAFSLIPWTDPSYVAKLAEYETTIDPVQSRQIGDELQQMFWQSAAAIVFFYPSTLEGYDTADWQGYTPAGAGANGDPLYLSCNVDTYVNLEPRTTATAAVTSGSSNTTLVIVVVVVVVIAVAIVVLVLLRRRRGPAVEA